MAKTLIIVESPAKTKTLKNFLGGDYMVEASMGHVRDLPAREIAIDVDNDFLPKYVDIPSRKEVLKKLTAAAAKADVVLLASDPDREGEAISWHLAQALKLKNPQRIQFNEITKTAVQAAIQNPRPIDMPKVDAQESRRLLDRLVGYRLSPLLWKKVGKNLSAGRVQSVAVRIVCDREREIQAFNSEEYWSLTASLTPQAPAKQFPFDARFVGRGTEKISLKTEEETTSVINGLAHAQYVIVGLKQREKKRNAAAPFITSTLQQEASRKLGYGSKKAMSVAQKLYEGMDLGEQGAVGLITYMRTDSTRVAAEAQAEARDFIQKQYSKKHVPAKPPMYKSKNSAQDAHEAIRPTSVFRTPDSVSKYLKADELKLYRLIWMRFIASQMAPAVFDVTTADILANSYMFRATGSVVKFDGFMAVYLEGKDTEEKTDEEKDPLPALALDQVLDLITLLPKQHFTEPPPRYSEATLVKALEEKGIGRPSTYASIISTIQDREYVAQQEKRFHPTELGFTVNDLLVKHFPVIMEVGFTSAMETKLDCVEEGTEEKVTLLREFYGPFDKSIAEAHENMERVKPEQVATEHMCPNCGKPMMLRQSKRGAFLGCSGYPKCKTIMNIDEAGNMVAPEPKAELVLSDEKCPKCGKAMIEREGKFGKFYGCSGYPKCKTIVNIPGQEGMPVRAEDVVPAGLICPKDGGEIQIKRTRYGSLFACANGPACDYKSWGRLTGEKCPSCTWPLGESKFRGKPTGKIKCSNPDCDFETRMEVAESEAAMVG